MIGFGSSPLELLATDAMLRGKVFCQEFVYSAIWEGANALGANGSIDVQIQIDGESDFVSQEVNLVVYSAADTIVDNPDMTTLWTIAGSGRNLMNQAQHVLNVCGAYERERFPGRLSYPFLIPKKQVLTVNLTDLSAVASDHIHMSFRGFKVFYNENFTTGDVFRRNF